MFSVRISYLAGMVFFFLYAFSGKYIISFIIIYKYLFGSRSAIQPFVKTALPAAETVHTLTFRYKISKMLTFIEKMPFCLLLSSNCRDIITLNKYKLLNNDGIPLSGLTFQGG